MVIRLAGSLLASFLLVLCFPRFDLQPLAWIALAPLLLVLHGQRPRNGFTYGFLFGVLFLMGVFSWINTIPSFRWFDFVSAGAYWGFYYALFGVALSAVSRKTAWPLIITAPALWVAVEYCRSHFFFLNLPLALLGHSQYLNPSGIQIAEFTGVYGVSFLLVMVNAAVAQACLSWQGTASTPLSSRFRTLIAPGLVGSVVLILTFGYGYAMLLPEAMGESITVTVIQANIAQDGKWDPRQLQRNLERHVQLSRKAATDQPTTLIVWPEASVQGALFKNLETLRTVSGLAKELEIPLLVGSSTRPKFGNQVFRSQYWQNSAILISSEGAIERVHNKLLLLPFAEYLPYENFPWPDRVKAQAGHFIPGKDLTLFRAHDVPFGVLICWEAIFSDLSRRFVNKGARFLVNIANEAWFGETAGPYQFLSANVFRAVENRVMVLRATNTGVSGFIDPSGRILGRLMDENQRDLFISGFLTRTVPVRTSATFYTRHGDLWAYANVLLSVFLIMSAGIHWLRERSSGRLGQRIAVPLPMSSDANQ